MVLQPVLASSSADTPPTNSPELRSTFRRLVGQVFYGQLLKSLRQGVGKPAYLHGGQAEDLFQAQLDQHLVETFSEHANNSWFEELFQQFERQLNQSGLDGHTPLNRNDPEHVARLDHFTSEDRLPVSLPASQPLKSSQTLSPARSVSQENVLEAVRQTQPDGHSPGMKTGAAALSGLIRK